MLGNRQKSFTRPCDFSSGGINASPSGLAESWMVEVIKSLAG
jgi:hypothetical protein